MVSGRKRKTPGSGRGKSLFCRKNLELAATICLLSLAVVLFARILRWEPVAGQSPGAVQRQLCDREEYQILPAEEGPCGRPEILQDYIVKNPYSRSGVALEQVNGIVVHYVANAGSTARENRDYFENLKDTHLTKASSHFIIGLDGRSFNASLWMRYPMPPMRETGIRSPLNAVIRKKMESLIKKRTARWCGSCPGSALPTGFRIPRSSVTMM